MSHKFPNDPAFKWRSQYNPLRGLTIARVVSLLEEGMAGRYADLQWLFAAIERREPTLRALKRLRTAAIAKLDWSVRAIGHSAAAETQRATLSAAYERIENLQHAIRFLALAEFRGFAHLEILRDPSGNPIRLDPVDQWFFARECYGAAWLYNPSATNTNQGTPVPTENFIIREVGDPIDEIALIAFVRKSLSQADWDGYVETFGIPPIFCTLPNDTPEDAVESYQAMIEAVISRFRGVLPAGSKVDTLTTGKDGATPFLEHIKYQDEQLVLAGTSGKLTMISDATGLGSGVAQAQQDMFDTLAQAEAAEISEAFQVYFDKPFLATHFPGQPVLAYFELHPKAPETPKATESPSPTSAQPPVPQLKTLSSQAQEPPSPPSPQADAIEALKSQASATIATAQQEDWRDIQAKLATIASATNPESFRQATQNLLAEVPSLLLRAEHGGKAAKAFSEIAEKAAKTPLETQTLPTTRNCVCTPTIGHANDPQTRVRSATEIAIGPNEAARRNFARKIATATPESSEVIASFPQAARDAAFFSARLNDVKQVSALKDMLQQSLDMPEDKAFMSKERFVAEARKMFGGVDEKGVANISGDSADLTDHTSQRRLALIYDVQIEEAFNRAKFVRENLSPDILDAFPAQELLRVEPRKETRDWAARWQAAGGKLSAGSRMIARKDDPVWQRLGDSGPFGHPYPPFDFGSGMGVEDIDREEAETLGIINPTETVAPTRVEHDYTVNQSAKGVPPEILERMSQTFPGVIRQGKDGMLSITTPLNLRNAEWEQIERQNAIDALPQLPEGVDFDTYIADYHTVTTDTGSTVKTDLSHLENNHDKDRSYRKKFAPAAINALQTATPVTEANGKNKTASYYKAFEKDGKRGAVKALVDLRTNTFFDYFELTPKDMKKALSKKGTAKSRTFSSKRDNLHPGARERASTCELTAKSAAESSASPTIHGTPHGEFQAAIDGWICIAYPIQKENYLWRGEKRICKILETITPEDLAAIAAEHAANPREILVDFDHQSEDPSKPTLAAAWITQTKALSQGLYAKLRLSGAGKEALEAGNYRYFSPTFDLAHSNYREGDEAHPVRLVSGALTNRPSFKKLSPLSSREIPGTKTQKPTRTMDYKNLLITLLGLAEDISDDDLAAAIAQATAAKQVQETQNAQLKSSYDKLLDEQINRDLDAHSISGPARNNWKAALTRNRDEALTLLKSLRPAHANPARLHNSATAVAAVRDLQTRNAERNFATEDEASRARSAAIHEYQTTHKCSFREAWTALQLSKPTLFQDTTPTQ